MDDGFTGRGVVSWRSVEQSLMPIAVSVVLEMLEQVPEPERILWADRLSVREEHVGHSADA